MSPDTAWDRLGSAASKITNMEHSEVLRLLKQYSREPDVREQFHYRKGEPFVFPPKPRPVHQSDTRQINYNKDVWEFACPEDAESFIFALNDYWEAEGYNETVRAEGLHPHGPGIDPRKHGR